MFRLVPFHASRSQVRFEATTVGVSGTFKKTWHSRSKVSEHIGYNGEPGDRYVRKSFRNTKISSNFTPRPKGSHQKGPNGPKGPKGPIYRQRDHSEQRDGYKGHVSSRRSMSRAPGPDKDAVEYLTRCEHVSRPNDAELRQIHKPDGDSIPKLAHKLDRVLFSPGVHFLQDPRTRVYNFSPYLKSIVSHEDFDFEKIQKFVSASKDNTLLQEARKQNRKFYSSTSSMTSTLHQFYLFLNNYSPSQDSKYRFDFPEFSKTARDLPSAVFVEPKGVNEVNGERIYSVTSDKSTDVEILLSAMGHCLEALLTTEEEEFKEFLIKRDGDNGVASIDVTERSPVKSEKENAEERAEKVQKTEKVEKTEKTEKTEKVNAETAPNVYNYSAYGDFLMRSQLDCYDSRLPGNGTFDLKTRAAASIRYDKSTKASNSTYQIWKQKGNIESFQREYEDLIRTGGLLKYGFQARIGQMDGIFVAYHNINSFFGFQYLPLNEIDKVFFANTKFAQGMELYGSAEEVEQHDNIASIFAEAQFKASLDIWQDIMKTVEDDFKGTKFEGSPFRLMTRRVIKPKRKSKHSYTSGSRHDVDTNQTESVLSVFAVPVSRADTYKIQQVSSKYQTSFREDISDKERLKNLEKIQEELNDLNEALVTKNELFSYIVEASFFVNGKDVSNKANHPYPKKGSDGIEWRYNIKRICKKEMGSEKTIKKSSSLSVDQYLQSTRLCTNMLTKAYKEWPDSKAPSLTDTLRKFSEVGQIRLDKWKDLENPPKTYESQ